jgi:hypothetical protein
LQTWPDVAFGSGAGIRGDARRRSAVARIPAVPPLASVVCSSATSLSPLLASTRHCCPGSTGNSGRIGPEIPVGFERTRWPLGTGTPGRFESEFATEFAGMRSSALRAPGRRPAVSDQRTGRDAIIAATALVHRLAVATRNVANFRSTGAALLDRLDPACGQGSHLPHDSRKPESAIEPPTSPALPVALDANAKAKDGEFCPETGWHIPRTHDRSSPQSRLRGAMPMPAVCRRTRAIPAFNVARGCRRLLFIPSTRGACSRPAHRFVPL